MTYLLCLRNGGDVDWGDLGYAWVDAAGGFGCAAWGRAYSACRGCGGVAILDALREIAPVTAIRGNVDVAEACADLPATDVVELGGQLFYLVHSVHDLDINARAAGVAMVVSGHSHKAKVEVKDGVVYFNPGSAGPRRFSLPVTVGFVTVEDGVEASVKELFV
ncbi:metallophosphoesterase family protein [Tunturiibacter gelidiferens]|uniref:metallophosphoesterase family protein n=1 Tax=Tunturiibacter gelidiferens TaxID=3069689 RepID=UPI003D9AEC0E